MLRLGLVLVWRGLKLRVSFPRLIRSTAWSCKPRAMAHEMEESAR